MTSSAEPASVLDRMLAILDFGPGFGRTSSRSPSSRRRRACRSRPPPALPPRWSSSGISSGPRTASSSALRVFELGARASLPRRLRAAAGPIIRNLWDLTGERIGLWVPRDTDMVSIAAVPGRLPMLSTRAGTRSPALTTASGKAFLAFCDDRAVVDRISAPLVEDAAARFRSELTEVRASAIATDQGIAYPGILAVASPVRVRRRRGDRRHLDRRTRRLDGCRPRRPARARRRSRPLPSPGCGLDADANGGLDGLGQCARPRDRRAGGVRRR